VKALGCVLVTATCALAPTLSAAWPADLTELMARDARRAVPLSLARLLSERESVILERVARYPPELTSLVESDLIEGRLRPGTLDALDAEAKAIVGLLQSRHTNEALFRLGAILRVVADISDPVLSAGPRGYPAGVTREYYQFTRDNLDKITVVLDEPGALTLRRNELPAYWQGLVDRSRKQAPVIRAELFKRGKIVDRRTIDYRNPVFGVASISYSRTVTAIAATWLAIWRDARGDTTRLPAPKTVGPHAAFPSAETATLNGAAR